MASSGSNILVIPAVSAGNIPQLTVDLLIHNLGAKFIQKLDDRYLYPFAGPRDGPSVKNEFTSQSSEPSLTTPIELYQSEDIPGLTLIQFRSPTLPGCRTKFVLETLIPVIEAGNFSDVVVLGSSNAAFEHSGNPFETASLSANNRLRIFTTDQQKGDLSERLASLTLAGSPNKQLPGPPQSLPESGIVLDVLNHITKPPVSAIVAFAYEGDNFGDAEWLAGEVSQMLNLKTPSIWQYPKSWEGAYGKAIPVGVEEGLYS